MVFHPLAPFGLARKGRLDLELWLLGLNGLGSGEEGPEDLPRSGNSEDARVSPSPSEPRYKKERGRSVYIESR